jgi:hypothetical protein
VADYRLAGSESRSAQIKHNFFLFWHWWVPSMKKKDNQAEYSDEEIVRRRDELAKRILNTPPQPQSEMKLGPKAKPDKANRK